MYLYEIVECMRNISINNSSHHLSVVFLFLT